MASVYDNIKNPKDLLILVQRSGLRTTEEDICRVQDIFGHATEEELVALANDNGRSDEKGNPNPRGSWSSGRNGLGSVFYFVLFKIWNWEDATRFFNKHSNLQVIDALKEFDDMKVELEQVKGQLEGHRETEELLIKEKERADAAEVDKLKALSKLKDAEDELIRLKAKLYDLLEDKLN